jgi:hypothetical protein
VLYALSGYLVNPAAIAVWKTRNGETMFSDIRTRNLSLYQELSVITHEKTVPRTLWYLACTEGSTADHREPK